MKTVLLSDVCEIFAGGDIPKVAVSKQITHNYGVPIYTNGEKNYGLYGYTNSARVNKPSVTISARGTIGYPALRMDKFYPAVRLIVLTPDPNILDVRYLFYAMKNVDFSNTGVSIPQLTVPMIKKYHLQLVSAEEQKRVVERLDEVFGAIDKAIENTEKNLKNTQELFASELEHRLNIDLKDSPTMELSNVCSELFAGGDVPKQRHSKQPTEKYRVPIYSNGVKGAGLYGYTDIARVFKPSVTISARGTIGHAELRQESFFPVVRLIVLTPNSLITLKYLYYVIKINIFANTGTSIPQLTVPMVRNRFITVPGIDQQNKIVEKLDKLSEQTQKLQKLYQKKLDDLKELKQSYLNQAFSGKL